MSDITKDHDILVILLVLKLCMIIKFLLPQREKKMTLLEQNSQNAFFICNSSSSNETLVTSLLFQLGARTHVMSLHHHLRNVTLLVLEPKIKNKNEPQSLISHGKLAILLIQ